MNSCAQFISIADRGMVISWTHVFRSVSTEFSQSSLRHFQKIGERGSGLVILVGVILNDRRVGVGEHMDDSD